MEELVANFHEWANRDNQDVCRLEMLIQSAMHYVSSILWKVILEECHLSQHLHAFKSYYLLGNAEFFDALVEEFEILRLKSATISEYR